jgi:ketosteroid isomerase-like protein
MASGPDHLGREGDRVAIAELFNRYMDALDRKDWDLLLDVFTEDATARVTFPFPGVPAQEFAGRDAIIGFASAMVGSSEIATQHLVGNFSATFDGDTAEAKVRMRNHHAGVGPRAGLFQESIGAFGGTFVRTAAGWRCSHWYEDIWVNLGDGESLFAPEIGGSTDAG